jgi:hypothetical protein
LADGIPARLSPKEGRKFGLTVGVAFLVLGGISRWRGHDTAPLVLWSLGGLLTVAGAVIPGQLGGVFRAWMGLAHLLSKVTTPIFMGVIYFVVIAPMGLVMRAFGKDPLAHRATATGYWITRTPDPDKANSLSRQF